VQRRKSYNEQPHHVGYGNNMNSAPEVRLVRVFVSSPNDVAPERARAEAVAAKLNREYDDLVRFETVLWEEQVYKADRTFQAQIPESIDCDIVVSIFWTRLGTELPDDFQRMEDGRPYPSGAAYELLTALKASRHRGVPDVYVFRKSADIILPTTDAARRRQAQNQLDYLEAFWTEWFTGERGQFKAAFQHFSGTDEFEHQLDKLLRQWLDTHCCCIAPLCGPPKGGRRSVVSLPSRRNTRPSSLGAPATSTRRAGLLSPLSSAERPSCSSWVRAGPENHRWSAQA
jgi:hypothetical protein